MICVRSVLFSAMGKYLENLSIKKLLWRHAEGFSEKTHKQLFIQIKMFITTNFSTEHCEQAFKPCLFSITLIFECNDFTSKSNQQMKDKSHCHTFFFSTALYPWVFWFETSCPRTKTVCLYLSSRSLSLCHPSGTQGCVCETGRLGGLELLYLCCFFSTTIAAGWGTETNFLSFPFLPCFLPSFLTSSFLSFLFLF